MILETIKCLLTIVVALSGGALLILGIIYEDVLIAFESGMKKHIKRKVKTWKRKTKSLFSAMFSIIAEK